MKRSFFASVFIAAVCSVSCSKEQIAVNEPPVVAGKGEEVEINVSVPVAKTKYITSE